MATISPTFDKIPPTALTTPLPNCPLEKLPAELRLEIFKLVLACDVGLCLAYELSRPKQ